MRLADEKHALRELFRQRPSDLAVEPKEVGSTVALF
jgi:hypothetical protein